MFQWIKGGRSIPGAMASDRRPRHRRSHPKVPRPPPPSSLWTSIAMQGNRAKGTKPELALVDALKRHGVRRFTSNAADLPGKPDITFPALKLAVFVHGCFWHRCPHHRWTLPKSNTEYWRLKFRLNRARDRKKARELRVLGWQVIAIWECEIRRDADACAKRLREALALQPGVRCR